MPTKKKRLTQREKAERAAMKKQLQAEGVLPPDKPRLNRKKFARETWAEWEEFLKGDPIRAEVSLLRAVEFIAGPELPAVTPEQVGVYPRGRRRPSSRTRQCGSRSAMCPGATSGRSR